MITAHGIGWRYGAATILDDVGLVARPGRVLGLIGPNGSGKTTLLRLLYGALASPAGSVEIDGAPLTVLRPREAARRMAVVVQENGGESTMTVAEMVLLGRGPHLATFQRTTERDHRIAARALRRVGADHLGGRAFAELSGGERQRVLIARALTQEATHLLLDEPTNHLDIRYQHEVLRLIAGLVGGRVAGDADEGGAVVGTTAIVVLHDLNLAAAYCDDVVLLHDGGVAAAGTAAEVLRPEVLEPVYEIAIQRLEVRGRIHLLFEPRTAPVDGAAPAPASPARDSG